MLSVDPAPLRTLCLDSWMLFGLFSHQLSTYFIFMVYLGATSSHPFKYLLKAYYLSGLVVQQDKNSCLHGIYILEEGADKKKIINYIGCQKVIKYYGKKAKVPVGGGSGGESAV